MTDAKGRQGGASQFLPVLLSADATCLDKNSPASASNAPSMTRSASPTKSTKPAQTSSKSSASATSTTSPDPTATSNGGTIAAAIVGVAVALLVFGTLFWFYLRRRNGGASPFKGTFFGRRFQKKEVDLMKTDSNLPPPASLSPYPLYHTGGVPGDVSTPNSTSNLIMGRPSDVGSGFGAASTINFGHPPNSAFSSQFPPSARPETMHEGSLYGAESAYGGVAASGYGGSEYGYGGAAAPAHRPEGSVSSWDQSLTSSAARRKAAQAGVSAYQPPARFILHTDIEDDIPPPPEDEVIELPPQYSERRAPPPASPGAGGSGASASSPGLAYLDSRPS